ncbi:hypothetical protein [Cellulomonas marina]|uniref:RelA/SpoT domain-containing protein n=1 Tax=Cellulomonas marina TaxID=988821 RepID=A0A1I0X9J5_9CELL|nr:hypothetical protein [Cellulomonas marina]GIG29537.1 hypothetical protein Cma02nite_21370 [Cellulomonas marina]SFA97712.1 hypothetical protein SAMN05421867_104231 [Cellulomonas marina]
MKIDPAIRTRFERQAAIASALKREVDRDLLKRKHAAWHYESRVKADESFALKVETGRVKNLDEVEDVFGATLVVPNSALLADAEAVVTERYRLQERRPLRSQITTKKPEEFRFDDIRLYVRYARTEGERTAIPDGALFEVQVKTFLQHAWTVATHDLVYKSDQRDWRRERVAYQIKANLEQAEVVIGAIEGLAASAVLPAENPAIDEINLIIAVLSEEWSGTALPRDVRRLAESIQVLLTVVESGGDTDKARLLKELLVRGRERSAGAHSLDWSPYRSVLNYVAHEHEAKLRKRVRGASRQKLLMYPETLAALGTDPSEASGAVVVT